ncbi:MAG: Holliday junction branch migration protein RuvA [Clostridiales bacterium]|nr:Holliday junction branch migration protein RuvA [Clostridiales bacterium]
MFYYVKGKVAHLAPNLAVIDCGGVGYACRTTSYTLSALQVGQEGTLYTHLNVREDAMDLYGFATENERSCFQMLIAISGVGPKAALSILSAANPEGLATAIITGNEKTLMVAPGIGKKTAQRIILELKDKLAKGQLPTAEESYGGTGITVIPQDKVSEATAALAVLGYQPAEITTALKGLDLEGLSLEELIRQALKKMVK